VLTFADIGTGIAEPGPADCPFCIVAVSPGERPPGSPASLG